MRLTAILLTCAVAAFAGTPEVVKETADQIERNLKADDFIAVRAAYGRAFNLRDRYDDETLDPVVDAIGRGVKHDDKTIARLSIDALKRLRVSGSARWIAPLLRVPKTPDRADRPLHVAAIEAAGAIHDRRSAPALKRLIHHDDRQIAVTAATALRGYRTIDRKPRIALVRRLAVELSRLERQRPRSTTDEEHRDAVRKALVETLVELTRDDDLETASDARAWAKLARRELAEENAAFAG